MNCIKCGTEHPIYLRCPQKTESRDIDQTTADERYKNRQQQRVKDGENLYKALRHPNAISLTIRLVLKKRAVASKGGQCKICGYSKCLRALEFHHLERHNKLFSISAFVGEKVASLVYYGGNIDEKDIDRLWVGLTRELQKCVLLCANCHREVEAGETELEGPNGS
jgi:hypothetical protein